MSKRVQIAVIREATLNAKPTDTHYLAEGGICISRKDAVALKGTTLYYQEIVDLGQVTGGDFIPGRDIPVYTTDSEPVLAIQPHMLKLVDNVQPATLTLIAPGMPELNMHGISMKADTSVLMQNAVEPIDPVSKVEVPLIPASALVPDAPVKRRPGRPKKVVAAPAPEVTPDPAQEPEVTEEIPAIVQAVPDFEVDNGDENVAKQEDESTFLIDPNGPAPTPVAAKREFSFELDEDEAPPPPRTTASAPVDFEVEEDETPAAESTAASADPEPELPKATSINTDDYAESEPGLFDE
jgi:hypothetical protein